MPRLILLRHPTPRVAPGTCYGRTDMPLAHDDAQELPRILAALPAFDHLISSPLQRCRVLAEAISERTGKIAGIQSPWIEMDFGAWEGKAWSDLPRADLDQWADDFLHYRGHGGESVAQLRDRVATAMSALPKGDCLVVTHMGAIKAALHLNGHADAWNAKLKFGEMLALPKSA